MWKFLENKALEVTAGACFLSITEIINRVQQIGSGALLVVNFGPNLGN